MAREFLSVQKGLPLEGEVALPGDKSISHRALIFASLAAGTSDIQGFLPGRDCLATLNCMRSLGVNIEELSASHVRIEGRGLEGLKEPSDVLDCENSGTTMRLLAGVLAGQKFHSVLTGSKQLRTRPMARVLQPLREMGGKLHGRDGDRKAPIIILGQKPGEALSFKKHSPEVASAQVKSAILLAGLFANGVTEVHEAGPSRDHTERLLRLMNAPIWSSSDGLDHRIERPIRELQPVELDIPGDMSSAAFLILAGLLVEDSVIKLKKVCVNPTRTGLLEALTKMGAHIELHDIHLSGGEPVANVIVKHSELRACDFSGHDIVRMIDEIPLLALAACFADGETRVSDAGELRHKESDRISATIRELRTLGAKITEKDDGFIVKGPCPLQGGTVDSHGDHRLAMMLAVAGLTTRRAVNVQNSEVIPDSFPNFVRILRDLGARLR